MHDLHELKEKLLKELEEYGGNAKFSKEDVETIKYMASAIDHICNISEDEEGYSNHYPYYMDGSYDDGMKRNGSYRGRSYAGRRNARRDSMGRYARDGGYSNRSYRGYSRDGKEEYIEQLRGMMEDAPDASTRSEIQRLADKMETM